MSKDDKLGSLTSKEKTIISGIVLGFSLIIYFIIPIKILNFITLVTIPVSGFIFLFQGSTLISMSLNRILLILFQVFISIAFPICLSIYFLQYTDTVIVEHLSDLWFLLPLLIIFGGSWILSENLDPFYPFRGFLIAALIFFLGCFLYYQDPEVGRESIEAGKSLGLYIVYTTTSYIAMLIRLLYSNKKNS